MHLLLPHRFNSHQQSVFLFGEQDWLKEVSRPKYWPYPTHIQLITENRLRHARGPVQFHIESVPFIYHRTLLSSSKILLGIICLYPALQNYCYFNIIGTTGSITHPCFLYLFAKPNLWYFYLNFFERSQLFFIFKVLLERSNQWL